MLVEELLPLLEMPDSAIVNQPIPRGDLIAGGVRYPGDHQYLQTVESIRLLAALNSKATNLQPYFKDDRLYLDVNILAVNLRPNASVRLVAETIHSLIPQPTAIFYCRENAVCEVSLAHKIVVRDLRHRFAIDREINHCPLEDAPPRTWFFKSLQWADLPKENTFVFYDAWYERVNALKAATLTGEFRLCETPEQSILRHRVLVEYERQFRARAFLRRSLKDQSFPDGNKSMENEIQGISEVLKGFRESLKSMAIDPKGPEDNAIQNAESQAGPAPLPLSP